MKAQELLWKNFWDREVPASVFCEEVTKLKGITGEAREAAMLEIAKKLEQYPMRDFEAERKQQEIWDREAEEMPDEMTPEEWAEWDRFLNH